MSNTHILQNLGSLIYAIKKQAANFKTGCLLFCLSDRLIAMTFYFSFIGLTH